MRIINRAFGVFIIAIIVVAICAAFTDAAKDALLEVLRQFPLFDIMVGCITYKTFPNLLGLEEFLNFLLEIMKFVIVVFIYDWLFEYVVAWFYKPTDRLIDKIIGCPVKIFIGVFVRFAIVALLSFAIGFIQKRTGTIGKTFAILAIFVGAFIVTMLRDKDKRIIVRDLLLESLKTIGILSICTAAYLEISNGVNVSGVLVFGVVFTLLFSLIKGFINYMNDQ